MIYSVVKIIIENEINKILSNYKDLTKNYQNELNLFSNEIKRFK